MKFIFLDSFDLVWNGKTARYNNGVSGSHNATMYLAEALARDNDVEIISTKNNIIEDTYLNVKYTNISSTPSFDCDYVISTNCLTTLDVINKITYKKLLILTHNDLCYYDKLFTIDKNKIVICYISEFAKRNIFVVQPFLKNYESILLYNSIDLNDLPFDSDELSLSQTLNEKTNLCYFACIERGFKMTLEILNQVDYKMYTNTYYQPFQHLLKQNNCIIAENSAKHTIFNYLKKSKYFVYPLINLDNGVIHYDTFAYVVLEALLMGVVVIAPKIGVYEELYGDAVCYIETDDIIPKEDLLNWKKRNHNFGYPLLQRYVEKIKLLDSDANLRNSYIKKGLLLKDKFSNTTIANVLLSYLN
jgi:hypothetical protein